MLKHNRAPHNVPAHSKMVFKYNLGRDASALSLAVFWIFKKQSDSGDNSNYVDRALVD